MSNTSTITNQVSTAIASAHKNINSASQLLPNDEQQLVQMSTDLHEKMDDLKNAQEQLSTFLAKHCRNQPSYS